METFWVKIALTRRIGSRSRTWMVAKTPIRVIRITATDRPTTIIQRQTFHFTTSRIIQNEYIYVIILQTQLNWKSFTISLFPSPPPRNNETVSWYYYYRTNPPILRSSIFFIGMIHKFLSNLILNLFVNI